MEVGSQTDPMDATDILNLLRQREKEETTRNKSGVVGVVGEDEIQTVEIIDGEVFFNSHNEPEFGKNGQSGGKSLFTKSKSHPAGEPSLTDKICEVVWSRKESIHGVAGGSSSGNSSYWKSKRLGRSHSFKGSSSFALKTQFLFISLSLNLMRVGGDFILMPQLINLNLFSLLPNGTRCSLSLELDRILRSSLHRIERDTI